MTRPAVFLNIKTQFDNAGDALIIREMIRLAAARADVTVFLGRAPEHFRDMLALGDMARVTTSDSRSFARVIAAMIGARLGGRAVHYLLIPGGLNGERSVKQTLSALVGLLVFALLKLVGVNVSQVGISLERIGRRHRAVLRLRSRLIHATSVRDLHSETYAKDLGLRVTHRAPDLAMNLFAGGPQADETPRNTIAFSFRADKNPDAVGLTQRFVEQVCAAAGAETDVVFIAQVGRDLPFMERVYEAVSPVHSGQVSLKDTSKSIDQSVAVYEQVKVLYSNRLHALLLGASAGATPVALIDNIHDVKIRGVFEDIGLGDQLHNISAAETLDFEALLTQKAPVDGREKAQELSALFDALIGASDKSPSA